MKGIDQSQGPGHYSQSQFDADGAGLLGLPAALQQSLPARVEYTPARRRQRQQLKITYRVISCGAMPSTEQLDQKAPSRTLDRESIPNLDLQALFSGEDSERA